MSIRWGIVSTGRIAHQFATDFAHVSGGEIVACQSRTHATAQAFAEQYAIPKVYRDYEELLAADDIDAVFDDDSPLPVEDECNAGGPALTGVLAPQQPLAAFTGEPLAGTWRMAVSDSAGGNTGIFTQWCLAPNLQSGPLDSDGDGVTDDTDNCTDVANPDQTDSNGDDIGNACDPDIAPVGAEDCFVNFLDLNRMKSVFFTNDADADLVGPGGGPPDGLVNFLDLNVMKLSFFGPPGPSAAGCN